MPGVAEISRMGAAAGQQGGERRRTGVSSTALTFSVSGDAAIDPVVWRDEEKMKRELVAWAKSVAASALRSSGQRFHE